MERAEKCAGKKPKEVLTDRNRSYEDGIEKAMEAIRNTLSVIPSKKKRQARAQARLNAFTARLKTLQRYFAHSVI